MRWVFEICLFEPNGELQIERKFRKPVFSIILTLNYFPPTEPEQERLPTFYAGPGRRAFLN